MAAIVKRLRSAYAYGPPREHVVADYGVVYFFMFCVYVCTCMVDTHAGQTSITCMHAASVIITDGNRSGEEQERTVVD